MADILIRGASVSDLQGEVIEIGYDAADCLYAFVNGGATDILEAIELPPHGDLIDRDALYALMETYTDYGGATEPHDENQIHRDSVLFAIETAPVIVPSNKEGSE